MPSLVKSMSRIGKKPVQVPAGVSIEINEKEVVVTGPKGKLASPKFPGITIRQEGNELKVDRENEDKKTRSFHGLARALVANNVVGTSEGFSKNLVLSGVGYRAQKKGKQLVMSVGLSHEVEYTEPEDVKIEVPEPTKINISGIDRQRVGQVAAEIRAVRKPEPYKGKGIRYSDEVIRRKAGKTGKK